jgi:hypothetical protein
MKIVKRSEIRSPILSISAFIIPSVFYLILKLMAINGGLIIKNEWIWWVAIPLAVIFWFTFNFKIIRKNND